MKTRRQLLDAEIIDLLDLAAEHSGADHTIWMDADSIAFVVTEHFTRGARRLVRQRLFEMRRCGMVESESFYGRTGWKLAEK